jgi:hypothetical protein
MITIKVGGTPLYIPEDTTLVLEQHNNSFDIDNIASDIIWTFDLPGKPNAVALDHAQYVNISNHKRYRCEISFNGVVISNGYLYIQGVTDETTISCGVVLDGLGQDGWGERKLKENDYGADVQISPVTATLDEHRQNWINFLTGSLSADSIYKFFLFCCERFYKNNEAFGYHQNQWSAIVGHDEDKTFAKYVNRLFYGNTGILTPNWHVMNTADTAANGLKLFNTLGNNTDKLNGYCFAPAIRLDWLVRKVFASAGYRVTGDFLPNEFIKKLYIQSMNAMDGDLSQFGKDEYLYLTGDVTGVNDCATEYSCGIGINEVGYQGFKLGTQAPVFNFRLIADVDSLVTGTSLTPTAAVPWTVEDEVFMLLVRSTDLVEQNKYPCVRSVKNHLAAQKDYFYGLHTFGPSVIKKYVMRDNNMVIYWDTQGRERTGNTVTTSEGLYCIQLTPSTGDSTASYPDPEHAVDILGNFTAAQLLAQGNTNNTYVVELAKFKVKSVQHGTIDEHPDPDDVIYDMVLPNGDTPADRYACKVYIEYYGDLEGLEYVSSIEKKELSATNTTMNVFDTMLRWKQHVPNVSNADFIRKLCRFFGLSMYVNPFHKEVQLSFINDVFSAGSIDITPYVIGSERLAYDPKQYRITAATVLGTSSPAEDFLLPDVDKRADLEAARSKKRMSVFIRNENAYNIASQDEKSKKYTWETNAGNDHTLVIGKDGDEQEEVTADISVPNMKVVDIDNTPKYLCDIETNGNSKLMDDDYTGDFDMILQQYKGLQAILIGSHLIGTFKIEAANPTCYDKNGNVSDDYLTLAATGRNSVGEKFLRRFYEFQADRENYRFTAKLPVDVFLKVYQMQMPQTAVGQQEKRWIMVQHRRYIPTTVSYEFGHGNYVLATIECARRHYE